MQYTLRNVPERLDAALRDKARIEGRSLNDVVIQSLLQATGLAGQPIRRRNLESVAGSWVSDAATEQALTDQRTIDPDLWA